MSALKINGYTIIASLQAWQEWEVELDEDGTPRLHWLINEQDDVSGNKIEEWTFQGGEFYSDDFTFYTFAEVKAYCEKLPRAVEATA